MPLQLSLQEINPCIRSAGRDLQSNKVGNQRLNYDYEIIYCHEGEFHIHYNSQTIHLKAGQIHIIPPNAIHRLEYTYAKEVYWAHFDFFYHNDQENLSRYIQETKKSLDEKGKQTNNNLETDFLRSRILISPNKALPLFYSTSNPNNTRQQFKTLIKLFYEKKYTWSLKSKAILNDLLCETFLYLQEVDASKGSGLSLSDSVIQYMKENTHRKITSGELSTHFHYHKDTLNRLVKEETGKTIGQHSHELRLEKVIHLLLSSDLTLDEISQHSAYSDRSHLIHDFKSNYNMTPTEFRKSGKLGV